MIRTVVVGASGRMGTLAVRAIASSDDLVLVGAVERRETDLDVPVAAELSELEVDCDVVLDLSNGQVAERTIERCTAEGIDTVIGASGVSSRAIDAARASIRPGTALLVVPNFSIGAVLLERFAAQAAASFPGVEVIEAHHDAKIDAPSGTSIATAQGIADARARAGLDEPFDPTQHETLEGSRGASGPGGIRIHAMRLPGVVARQEVHFAAPGEALVLRHDTFDRESFMPGVLASLRGVGALEGVHVGLGSVL